MTRWLDTAEQAAWRNFIEVMRRLPDRLNREIHDGHGLTSTDYEILVQLSEAPERRLRMSDLAAESLLSRSRLSHQITRMERTGLVRREECPSDRRGAFAVLTDEGWAVLVSAAPTHVEGVRRLVLDPLTREEFLRLGEFMARIRAGLDGLAAGPGDPEEACDTGEDTGEDIHEDTGDGTGEDTGAARDCAGLTGPEAPRSDHDCPASA